MAKVLAKNDKVRIGPPKRLFGANIERHNSVCTNCGFKAAYVVSKCPLCETTIDSGAKEKHE